ncbi:major capsid protein [Rhodococcus qingshengii]|uniref:hypothetical protein n=1 Tax=Rhodococcus TaxID=1827 RepID=UPI000F61F4C3|nr:MULTISPECIES: hypothetical protein [Rhodococcus]AZI61856.1 hypothetical protein EHW12_12260 [Rhodococcus sp. NJ-530]BDQ20064.1 major capsid protein [Rhodococcus qingshengii]
MANQPLYVDQALTNVSTAWLNNDRDFISDIIFPEVLVSQPTFEVAAYGKDATRVPNSSVRTGEALAKRVSLNRSVNTLGPLQEHALSDFVTKMDYKLSKELFEPEADAVENIHQKLALIDEKSLATQLADTSVITQNTTLSGASQWNDANSTPFQDIATGSVTAGFKQYNTLFMGSEAFSALMLHPELLDRIKWSQTGVLTEEAILTLFRPFGIERIVVGRAKNDVAKEGTGSSSFQSVWGKNAWLGYVTNRPARKELNGGYKFRLEEGREVTREVKANPSGTEIVVSDYYDHIIMNPEAFYLLKNVVA